MGDKFVGQIIAEKYRLESLLAENDESMVFRATNMLLDRSVTVQVVNPGPADGDSIGDFLAEAKAVSHISHPNILNISDFGRIGDERAYVVYEAASGPSLRQLMADEGRFDVNRAVKIGRQTASGLNAANLAGVELSDLTPFNILLDTSFGFENVKLLKLYSAIRPGGISTDDAGVTIASAYISPEEVSGMSIDGRTGIYRVGVILYQMLAGEPPFSGNGYQELARQIVEDPPPPLSSFRSDMPSNLEPILLKAMAKDPEMRHQTGAELAADLEDTSVQAATGLESAASNNNVWKTAFIVLVGITLLAAALIYATSVKQTDPKTRLQPDANGQPVQPINPATGAQEQSLANLGMVTSDVLANSNMAVPPGTIPGGDGYDPWKNGGQPPPGAPAIGPGGRVITIDPNNPSQFMPPEGGIVLVPVPANANTAKPTPMPKNAANANIQPSPAPKESPAVKSTPTTEKQVTKPSPQKSQPAPTPKPTTGKPDELE